MIKTNTKKFFPILFILVFFFQILSLNFIHSSPVLAKVYDKDLQEKARRIMKLEGLRECVKNYLNVDGINQGNGPFNLKFISGKSVAAADVSVGHGVDSKDGKWNCASPDQTREDHLFSLLLKNGSDSEYYTGWNRGTDPYTKKENKNIRDVIGDNHGKLYFINRNNDPNYDLSKKNDSISGNAGGPAHGKISDQISSSISQIEKGMTNVEKNAMKYVSLMDTFVSKNACGAEGPVNASEPGDKLKVGNLFYKVSNDNKGIGILSSQVSTGRGKYGFSSGNASCGDIAAALTSLQKDWREATEKTENDEQIPEGAGDTGGNESCEDTGGKSAWILCMGLDVMAAILSQLDKMIQNILITPDYIVADIRIKDAWLNFRNIAYAVLIPIFFVMIIGTALNFEFISAYTIKRAMPRMVIAVFFIALSYSFSSFFVNLTNEIGQGVYGIIMTAVNDGEPITISAVFNPSLGNVPLTGAAIFAGGIIAISLGSIGVILSYLLVGILGLGIGVALLVLRQFIIVSLIIVSPLAILSWIFPGNDKMWKLWWQSFSKLLMLYPLVMLVVAVGHAFALIINGI